MFTKTFFKGAGERAIKTFAQALLGLLTVGVAITAIDWPEALAIAATSALASVLTSIADPSRADTAIATGTTPATGKHALAASEGNTKAVEDSAA